MARRLPLLALATVASAAGAAVVVPVRPVPAQTVIQYLEFFPLAPKRLFDTRADQSQIVDSRDGALQPGERLVYLVGGRNGVSSDARAVAMNITAVNPENAGHLAVYPSNVPEPNVSNVNFAAGQVRPNFVQVGLDENGQFTVRNVSGGRTDVVADVVGYYRDRAQTAANRGSLLTPVTPNRDFDSSIDPSVRCFDPGCTQTTAATGPFLDAFRSRAVGMLDATISRGGYTSRTTAAVYNVTIDRPAGDGFLVTGPFPEVGDTSTLNYKQGQTVANTAFVPVSGPTVTPTGPDVVRTQAATSAGTGDSRVILDRVATLGVTIVAGPDAQRGGHFVTIPPCRLLDTRQPPFRSGPVSGPLRRGFVGPVDANGQCGLPSLTPSLLFRLKGLAVNVTAVNARSPGFLTLLPTAGTGADPSVSSVNFADAAPVANHAIVGLSEGKFVLYSSTADVDAIVDVFGYYLTVG